jgi:GNAT superfamily N-acetyltransferase
MNEDQLVIEEWSETHPRWPELMRVVEGLHQSNWVTGKADFRLSSHMLVARREQEIIGFLRFVTQEIGTDEDRPSVLFNGTALIEAKILAFGVVEAYRKQGVGRKLQEAALRQAKELGCYQVRSHSSGQNEASHHLKLAMGFGVHPIIRGEDRRGVYFVMPLKSED